jgi:hypothetical protein
MFPANLEAVQKLRHVTVNQPSVFASKQRKTSIGLNRPTTHETMAGCVAQAGRSGVAIINGTCGFFL